MNILIVLIFIGVLAVTLIAIFFIFTVLNEEYEHIDEVVWLPLEEESEIDSERS